MFNEIQFFRQKWIIILLLAVSAIPVFGLVYQLATGNPFGTSPMPNWGYILVLIPILGLNLLIFKSNLKTTYDTMGLTYRFAPFHFNATTISWKEVDQIIIRKYSPIKEYGGWGLRGMGKNRAFNVSRDIGVQLFLSDGRKILFGTQKWQEIAKVFDKYNIAYTTHGINA